MSAARSATQAHGKRDALVTLAALAALLLWDLSGLDMPAARLFGDLHGFAWTNTFFLSRVMHDGGRLLAWTLLAALVIAALRPPVAGPGPSTPAQRFRNMTKAMDSVRWQGANHSNARRHCEDLQRGHRTEGALSCSEISVAAY